MSVLQRQLFLQNQKRKVLWVDTETTGVDPQKNAVVQISGMIEIDELVVEEFNLFAAPFEGAVIDQAALDVNGRSLEEIMSFPPLFETMSRFRSILQKYTNKYSKVDKFVPAGFNVNFDYDVLYRNFKVVDQYGIGSYCFHVTRDVRDKVADAILELGFRPGKCNLSSVCGALGIELDAHDALNDIRATREAYYKLKEMLSDEFPY